MWGIVHGSGKSDRDLPSMPGLTFPQSNAQVVHIFCESLLTDGMQKNVFISDEVSSAVTSSP